MRTQQNPLIAERYLVEGDAARRGVVELWSATDRQLERPVTIQMLTENASKEPELCSSFLQHQQTACTIHNSAVRAVYDAGVWQSRPFSVMQVGDGVVAGALYRPGYPPDVTLALAATRQVAEGLQSCRDAGLTGWALSSEDVQIDPEGNAHFGIIDASLSPGNTEDDIADMVALSRLLRLILTGDPEADIAKLRAAQVPEVVIGLLGRFDSQEGNRVTTGDIATDIAAIEAASIQPTQAYEANAAIAERRTPSRGRPCGKPHASCCKRFG